VQIIVLSRYFPTQTDKGIEESHLAEQALQNIRNGHFPYIKYSVTCSLWVGNLVLDIKVRVQVDGVRHIVAGKDIWA
jgi:hypothetical protein